MKEFTMKVITYDPQELQWHLPDDISRDDAIGECRKYIDAHHNVALVELWASIEVYTVVKRMRVYSESQWR